MDTNIFLDLCLSSVYEGYKPFVEACIEEEENAEALKYIVKLTDPQERAEVCLFYDIHHEFDRSTDLLDHIVKCPSAKSYHFHCCRS